MLTDAGMLILDAQTRCYPGAGTVRFESEDVTVELSGNCLPTDTAVMRLSQGDPVAREVLPENVIQALCDNGVLLDVPSGASAPEASLPVFFDICDRWAMGVFASPFWEVFLAGRCSRRQVMGFLAQLYHRTIGADVHNKIAAELCSLPVLREMLARHYRDEKGHSTILADGLMRCGPAGAEALAAPPLKTTSDFVAYMVRSAEDPILFLGCYGVFHAPVTVRTEADLIEQFAGFSRLYPYAQPGFAAVCAHSSLDYKLGHDVTLLEQWFGMLGTVPPGAMFRALQGARGAAVAFRRIFDELSALP